MRRAKGKKAFTLLEVAIAMSILIFALTALMGHEGIAIQMSDYSNRLSQAVLLMQGKLLDVEYKLIADGMDQLDDCDEGDFSDEGYRNFKWKVCAYKLEMGEGVVDGLTEQVMAMFAGQGAGAMAGGEGGPAAEKTLMAQQQAAMGVGMVPSLLKNLEDKIRKVRVEVTWKDTISERSVVLERFITSLGEDRVGAPAADGDIAAELKPE